MFRKGDRVAKKSDVDKGIAKFYRYLEPMDTNEHKIVKCMCNIRNFELVSEEEMYSYEEARKLLSKNIFDVK